MIKQVPTDETAAPAPTAGAEMSQQELDAEADRLYQTYGKPLEQEHWGKYLAISPDGRTLLGDSVREVLQQATEKFGRGNFLFKVGEVDVWKVR